MRTFEKDYRYLLQNLIPHNRLPQDLRHTVRNALEGGDAADLRRHSILALESLRHDSYFLRTGTIFLNGYVIVTYAKKDGIYQLRITVPKDEWIALVPLERAHELTEDDRMEMIEPTVIPAAFETTIEILPDVIQSLSIGDRHDSIVERLNTLMRLIPGWLHFLGAEMLLLQESVGDYVIAGTHIRVIAEKDLLKTPIYSQVKSTRRHGLIDINEAERTGLVEHAGEARSVAIVPVFTEREFWGLVQLLIEPPVGDESIEGRITVAGRIVEQVITINNQIENITSIDTLTGIYNRHFYETQLPIEIERATRTAGKLSMLLIDIDDFKSINDALGHKKGDEALITVAELIKKNLRKIDMPFRYGGEEFVILLPGTAEIEAVHTAERLRSVISSYTDFTDNKGVPRQISVSIGVAVFPDSAQTEEELFVKADAAMFRAKHRGKNRIEVFK